MADADGIGADGGSGVTESKRALAPLALALNPSATAFVEFAFVTALPPIAMIPVEFATAAFAPTASPPPIAML